jgi:hypothetical protein
VEATLYQKQRATGKAILGKILGDKKVTEKKGKGT